MGRTKVTIYLKKRKEQLANILAKSQSLAKALLTGKDVSRRRMERRLEICNECDASDKSDPGGLRCGICRCKVVINERALINLARYEETREYGCKYKGGSKWKKNGV